MRLNQTTFIRSPFVYYKVLMNWIFLIAILKFCTINKLLFVVKFFGGIVTIIYFFATGIVHLHYL